jgi:uncharacterized membrane protein YgdD (TMEM256/DUF423 family)
MRALVVAASVCGLLLAAAGAIGAHAVPVEAASGWDSALLYGFVHTLAGLATALLPFRSRIQIASGWMFIAGVVLFSGVQIAKTLSASEGVSPFAALTMLVPVGGLAFMSGWLLLGLSALLSRNAGQD